MTPPSFSRGLLFLFTALAAITGCFGGASTAMSREYHVAVNGNDTNPGDEAAPLRTIQAAADRAMPGDTVTVHQGEYRERVDPPRGGTGNDARIVYRAAPGERVAIKGSETVRGWEHVAHDTWQAILPDSFFGDFNPYKEVIQGDWFDPEGRPHHRGAVYLNGHWLTESVDLAEVMEPVAGEPLWFTSHTLPADELPAGVGRDATTIWAQLPGVDPNEKGIEINVREAVFYPSRTGIDYITVEGFLLEQASPDWAPPTAEQVGIIGTHWSKGWIIQDNTVRYSPCVGVTLGKHGDGFDNTSEDSAEGYVATIERALARGWSKDKIGSHVVANNHVSHCEQAGIVGSLGAAFSQVRGNTIHDIHVRRLFGGAEMAAIKFHGAIDATIERNHIYRNVRGIWLDWMTQGTRVTRNLLHDNAPKQDFYIEVNHGPFMIDHNICLSGKSILDWSQGGAYVHNLFAGTIEQRPVLGRSTPYHPPNSTKLAGMANVPGGDNRFYNNVFIRPADLEAYRNAAHPLDAVGNVHADGTRPLDSAGSVRSGVGTGAGFDLVEKDRGLVLGAAFGSDWSDDDRPLVTTAVLGKAVTSGLPYVQPDGTPYHLATDYFGHRRRLESPYPGPFAAPDGEQSSWTVWPIRPPE